MNVLPTLKAHSEGERVGQVFHGCGCNGSDVAERPTRPGGAGTDPTYQSTPNLYPDFGTHQGWTPANGFDVVKADSADAHASLTVRMTVGLQPIGPRLAPTADVSIA